MSTKESISHNGKSSSEVDWKDKVRLSALNFLSLNRAKPGIFIAPYLLMKGWHEKDIGIVMFVNGVVSLFAQTPAGMLADMTTHKRTVVGFSNILICVMCLIFIISTDFWVTTVVMSLLGVGNALVYPAIYSITLGLVGQDGMMDQVPINETSVHGGNAFFAFTAGLIAYLLPGDIFIFHICAIMGIASCVSLYYIDPSTIDVLKARGITTDMNEAKMPQTIAPSQPSQSISQQKPMSMWNLACNPKVIVFLVSIMLFHFANASMLPLLAQVG